MRELLKNPQANQMATLLVTRTQQLEKQLKEAITKHNKRCAELDNKDILIRTLMEDSQTLKDYEVEYTENF
jgi:hypothetical protein